MPHALDGDRAHLDRSGPPRRAGAHDALLHPAHQPRPALRIAARGVAGPVPDARAVADLVRALGFRVVEIAAEHVRSRHRELADLAGGDLPLAPPTGPELDRAVVRA